MRKIFLFSLLVLSLSRVYSQETKKKLYFLADTINTPKTSRVLNILWSTPFHYSFIFYCKSVRPYYSYPEFACLVDKKNPRAEISIIKPTYSYISFKELMDIAAESNRNFNEYYELYITEVLPGHKYQTNKVKLMPQSSPTNTSTKFNNKH